MSTPPAQQPGSLNAPQRKAVTYGEPLPGGKGYRSGPLLVVAGAGTGKTNTSAHRGAHLARPGVERPRILMLTFKRRAGSTPESARCATRCAIVFVLPVPPPATTSS